MHNSYLVLGTNGWVNVSKTVSKLANLTAELTLPVMEILFACSAIASTGSENAILASVSLIASADISVGGIVSVGVI